jgi:cysteine desulfurase
MEQTYGNPSALHDMGMEAERLMKLARRQVAEALGTAPERLIFTSGGTEADNMALFQGMAAKKRGGRKLVTTEIEHPAILETCRELEKNGYKIARVGVDGNGLVDLEELEAALNEDTAMLSVMHVNNEVGTIQPIEAICRVKREAEERLGRKILLHSDAVQSFGKLPINLGRREWDGLDLLSVSAHKLHGPKGVGALYIRKDTHLEPLLHGGGQEGGLRPGTENVPGVAGFGVAAELAAKTLKARSARLRACRDFLRRGILDQIPDVRINGPADTLPDETVTLSEKTAYSCPSVLNVSFIGVKGEVLLHDLEGRGVFVSTGAACSSKKKGGSHVLAAMGLSEREMEGAIRFSFGEFNTPDEMERVIAEVKDAVLRFRSLSRFRRE